MGFWEADSVGRVAEKQKCPTPRAGCDKLGLGHSRTLVPLRAACECITAKGLSVGNTCHGALCWSGKTGVEDRLDRGYLIRALLFKQRGGGEGLGRGAYVSDAVERQLTTKIIFSLGNSSIRWNKIGDLLTQGQLRRLEKPFHELLPGIGLLQCNAGGWRVICPETD